MILVTGATGNVGRLTTARLIDMGAEVRGLSRNPEPSDIEMVAGDLSDASSLAPALRGVDTVFLIWKQVSTQNPEAAVDAIVRHARRIVYLSSVSVRDELAVQQHPMAATHRRIERLIRGSGAVWTVLRASWFMSNTIAWADEIRATGAVRFPFLAAGRSAIDPRDIAEVAALVLTERDAHASAIHSITGPEVLTVVDLVDGIGQAIGRRLRCVAVDADVYRRELLADGLPESLADAAVAHWRSLVERPEHTTDTVEGVTGHPARSFPAWAREHAAGFR